MKGVVVSYGFKNEYGFIRSPDVVKDVFFHRRDCGVAVPTPGTQVEFEIREINGNLRAGKVRAG